MDSTPQKKEELKKTRTFVTSYRKTNKNDYIILSGDLNTRIGNSAVLNFVRILEQASNTNYATYKFCHINNMKIMSSGYKHKNVPTQGQLAIPEQL